MRFSNWSSLPLFCLLLHVPVFAQYPSWWITGEVVQSNVTANDYAPAVAGQLKWMATVAKEELDENLLIGSGTGVAYVVNSFANKRNLAPALLGQLKNVSRPYYDRLIAAGFATNYPWSATTADDKDFAPALVGQLKNVFNFDITPDADGDGLPDWWEIKHGLNPTSGLHASLIGWWKFDDGLGTNANNSASMGYHGQLINMSTSTWASGKLGGALHFDGTNDYIRVPQSPALITGQQFSACAWVYLDTDNGDDYPTIISDFDSDPCYNGFWLGWDNWSPGVGAVVAACGSSFIYPSFNTSITGIWAHIAMTYDGSTLIVYRNGVKITSDSGAFTPAIQGELRIGWANDLSASYNWIGKLDDVRLYSSALTSNQVVNMYDIFNDQDGDGLNNLQEFQGGTDPANSNSYLTTLSGSISYSGGQTGVIRVMAANPSSIVYSAIIEEPGVYVISNIPTLNAYSLTAWRDSDGDQVVDFYEASGAYTNNPVMVSNAVSGFNVVLTDSDLDEDGMPDWWELLHQLNPVEASDADADADGDGNTNEEEYGLGTNPHGEGYVNSKEAKILIKDSGLYRITKSAITNVLDMTEAEVSNATFRLSNMGTAVPTVRDGGDVIFYGHEYKDLYTDNNVYVLREGPALTPDVTTVNSSTQAPLSYFFYKLPREHQIVRSWSIQTLNTTADPYYFATNISTDLWYWRSMVFPGYQYGVTFILDNLNTNYSGNLSVGVVGTTDVVGHNCGIKLNTNVLGSIIFNQFELFRTNFSIESTQWNAVTNTFTITQQSLLNSDCALNDIEIIYPRRFEIISSQLVMSVNSGVIQFTTVSKNAITIWNISNPKRPEQFYGFMQSSTNGYYINFSNSAETIVVCYSGEELLPVSITPMASKSVLSGTNCTDYLMIIGKGLENEAQDLANYRISSGVQVVTVPVEAVFDNMNHGRRHGKCVRHFVKYLHTVWASAPNYIVLIGDGSLDYKSVNGNDCQIPTEPIWDNIFHGRFHSSDVPVADFDLDHYPNVMVGRIPVNNTNDLAVYVSNIIAYESGGSWRTNTLIANGYNDGAGFFQNEAIGLAAYLSNNTHIIRADPVINLVTARTNAVNGIKGGLNLFTFWGHGTENGFHETLNGGAIVDSSDIINISTQEFPTIFVTVACSSGQFGLPGYSTISEYLLAKKGVGVAVLSSVPPTAIHPAKAFAYAVYDSFYKQPVETVGEAFRAGQISIADYDLGHAHDYQLLGDPALIINP